MSLLSMHTNSQRLELRSKCSLCGNPGHNMRKCNTNPNKGKYKNRKRKKETKVCNDFYICLISICFVLVKLQQCEIPNNCYFCVFCRKILQGHLKEQKMKLLQPSLHSRQLKHHSKLQEGEPSLHSKLQEGQHNLAGEGLQSKQTQHLVLVLVREGGDLPGLACLMN